LSRPACRADRPVASRLGLRCWRCNRSSLLVPRLPSEPRRACRCAAAGPGARAGPLAPTHRAPALLRRERRHGQRPRSAWPARSPQL